MNKNHTEEMVAPTPFYSQTYIFSDTANFSRIAITKDSISNINQIEIADGLKDSLIEHGIDLESLLNTTPERTATILGIDLNIAILIHTAAIKQCPQYHK